MPGQSYSSWYGLDIRSGGLLASESLSQLTGNLYLRTGSNFSSSLNSSGSGSILLDGNLSVSGNLLLDASGLSSLPGSPITLFDLSSGRIVSGSFSGLPEGSTLSAGDFQFKISYLGGDGNDVVLSPVPVPATIWLFGSGLVGLAGIGRARKREKPGDVM